MISVAKEDVLRGLKKFKRLAKQDLLASSLMSNPEFWRVQAETRRAVYDELMQRVEEGVEEALDWAMKAYAELPLPRAMGEVDPELKGRAQALEMFFTILGVDREQVQKWQGGRPAMGKDEVAVGASS